MPFNPSMRILIVDDFPAMRKLIKNALAELGLTNVCEAANGAQAVEKLEEECIDLVISDWNMPEMNGLQLLVHVRTSPDHCKLPFLMVTAENAKQNVVDALRQGVSNYVVKPFTAQILETKLRQIFK